MLTWPWGWDMLGWLQGWNCQNIKYFCSPPTSWQIHSNCRERNEMRNGKDLPFEGLKGKDHVGRGNPNSKYCTFPSHTRHTQCAQRLMLSNEECKTLLIMMLFQDLNRKLAHGIIKTLSSSVTSSLPLWKDVLNWGWWFPAPSWVTMLSLWATWSFIIFPSISPVWGLNIPYMVEIGFLFTL